MNKLGRFVRTPHVQIVVGILMLLAGGIEIYRELVEIESLGEHEIGAQHGIVLFAIGHILSAVSELFEGVEYSTDSAG